MHRDPRYDDEVFRVTEIHTDLRSDKWEGKES